MPMPNIVNYKVAELFGGIKLPAALTMKSWEPGNPLVPAAHGEYVFNPEELSALLMFLAEPCGDALFLSGPTGCGKTSSVLEAAARLNWPVQAVTCRATMEFADLVGHHALVAPRPGEQPVMRFMYGPLPKAMAHGEILLLNELDLMDPAELSGLNDVLEGRPLVIEQNGGMVIKPHPMFRVVATGNSAGAGDETGRYAGVQQQNLAAMDRFRMLLTDYPKPEVEKQILMKVTPALELLAPEMIALANEIRQSFLGEGEQHLSVTLSTRKLVQWAKLTVQLHRSPRPLKAAFELCLLNRCSKAERNALDVMCRQHFKSGWDNEFSTDEKGRIKP